MLELVLERRTARPEEARRFLGLPDVSKANEAYVEAMTDWNDPLYKNIVANLPAGTKPSDYVTSLEIKARKPGGTCCGDDCCKS